MAIKDTYANMRDLLSKITLDLAKAEGGNKAASQRVRTGTVKLEKVAKLYRKESIHSEKQSPKKSVKVYAGRSKAAHSKAKAPVKAAANKGKPSALSSKSATAKLPGRK